MKTKHNKYNKYNNNNNNNKNNNDNDKGIYEKFAQSKGENTHLQDDVISVINVIFVINEKDKIERCLFLSPKLPAKIIANRTGLKYDAVITELNRNKDSFILEGKLGRYKTWNLTESKRNEWTQKINNILQKKREQKLRKEQKILESEKNNKLREKITNCLKTFKNLYFYSNSIITLDAQKLLENEPEVFSAIEDDPETVLKLIEESFRGMGFEGNLRFSNINCFRKKKIFDIRAVDLDKALVIEAKVSNVSSIRPQAVQAKFECPNCGATISVLQGLEFVEPSRCSCGWKSVFKLLSTNMTDSAKVVLEDMDSISNNNINAFLSEDLLNSEHYQKLTPGQDIRVMGILKAIPITLSRSNKKSSRHDHALKIISFEEVNSEICLDDLPKDTINRFKELSKRIDKEGLQVIVPFIAPDIYGHESEKKAIALQSAQPRNDPEKIIRSKSNILLIGDPGLAKSVLMKTAEGLNYGSRFGSCASASQVGLTASVEKDDYGGYCVKAGLLPMTKDLCALDELNLLSDEDKAKLQQGINEMKITINKASIHTTLKVTAGILANANPREGKFNKLYPIIPQFNLYPPILNRMDLIFIITDTPNEETDHNISVKMIEREQNKIKTDYDFLRNFFLYVKSQPEPIFNSKMKELIPKIYVKFRKLSNQVTPRLNETILRLSKASARLRLSESVEEKDLKEVEELLEKSFLFEEGKGLAKMEVIKVK